MRILFFLSIVLLVTSCTKKEDQNNIPEYINISFAPTDQDTLMAQGTFSGFNLRSASGNLKVYKDANRQVLRFENFKCENGPDLKVYLSQDSSLTNFIIIGDLLAASGNFNYTFSVTIPISSYRYAIVKSTQLNSTFAFAEAF